MPAVNPSPLGPKPTFVDPVTGAIANGYQVFFYVGGSVNTKQATYSDSTGTVANANPLILNTAGEPTTQLWFTQGQAYKVLLATATDTDPPTLGTVLGDNLRGINDTSSATGITQWLAGPAPAFISGTQFSISGDQTSNFQVGRRVQTTNSGGTIYGRITVSSFSGGITTVTIVTDSGVLDSGLSAVNYGLLSSINPSTPNLNNVPIGLVTPSTGAFTTLSGTSLAKICDGRLTLTTGVPVTTADVTAATIVYFTPYAGGSIALYDGTAFWNVISFVESSFAVPASTSQMYDIFAFNNAGVLGLETLAWTNDTTRATALVLQNGVLVKSGVTTRRYLGSFRTTTVSGQTEDSLAKRYVWNYYNRINRKMFVADATATWNYTLQAFRQADGLATNQIDMVIGVSENAVFANVLGAARNTTTAVQIQLGIGLDSTTVNSADAFPFTNTLVVGLAQMLAAQYTGFPGIGRHFLAWLEWSVATGVTTWIGSGAPTGTSGISGQIWG
jgi:hypothetical protein